MIATALALACSYTQAASQAPVAAENGMVVAAQHLASRIGMDVLKNGGNAVDAAVTVGCWLLAVGCWLLAVGYALAVAYLAAGNLGGGGFMTIQLADGRKTFLDFREKAPSAATANMYLDKDGNVIPELSTRGHQAVGVPRTVSGMELALKKYGTMKRSDVIAPAIKYADDGFVLEQGDVDLLETATDIQKDMKDSGAIFLSNGQPMQVGQKTTGSAPASWPATPGSSSTTKWTISPPRWACPICTAWYRARPTPLPRARHRCLR
ncbi:Glutathione hydrolase proenzyme [compost metagenome]